MYFLFRFRKQYNILDMACTNTSAHMLPHSSLEKDAYFAYVISTTSERTYHRSYLLKCYKWHSPTSDQNDLPLFKYDSQSGIPHNKLYRTKITMYSLNRTLLFFNYLITFISLIIDAIFIII